jgi:HSP20 family protein
VRPEDVTIELEDRELRITGEYGTEEGDGEAQRIRRTGRFDYRITLPGEVDSEATTANLENGVLRLRLPTASSSRRQRITVQSGAGDSGRTPQTGMSR